MRACGGREASALQCVTHSAAVLKQGSIQQLNLLLLTNQGQWGVTAAEEEEENKRIREFQDSIPKMCSQLRILTHFYQGVVQQFLVLLTTSSDESLQFLSFRLDFNEHYKAREPRLRVSLGSRGRRSSHT